MVDIFQYTDFRKFLSDFYEAKRVIQKGFTHRRISQAMGFKSTGTFSQIIQGKTNITPRTVAQFAAFLGLKKDESDYFESLVFFNQSKGHAEKKRHFERILAFPQSNFKQVEAGQYAYYEKWYYTVIREILAFHRFRDDYRDLARMLEPPISPSDAQRAIRLLEDLRMIRMNDQGYYEKADLVVTSGSEPTLAVNQFIHETMDLAKAAMDNLPKQERSMSALTLSLPEEGYRVLEERIRNFRHELLALAQNSPAPKRVIQVNFQLFPVTRVNKEGPR